MQIDVTLAVVISSVTLLTSILSPVITTCINNHYQDKKRKFEFYTASKAEAIERYIRAAGALASSQTEENKAEYGKSYGEIHLYTSSDKWQLIRDVNMCIMDGEYDYIMMHLTSLCKKLANEHPRQEKVHKSRKKDDK